MSEPPVTKKLASTDLLGPVDPTVRQTIAAILADDAAGPTICFHETSWPCEEIEITHGRSHVVLAIRSGHVSIYASKRYRTDQTEGFGHVA